MATKPSVLRAEARVLAFAGAATLAASFPPTMSVALAALIAHQPPSASAVSLGALAMAAGYIACHLASRRLVQADAVAAKISQQPEGVSANSNLVLT